MKITVLKSKIHNAAVTRKNIDYEGSIEIDSDFLKKVGLHEWEKVLVVNINNGARFETYIIKGNPGSGIIGLQGGAARLGEVGDRLIIFSFSEIEESEAQNFKPSIIHLDKNNNILD